MAQDSAPRADGGLLAWSWCANPAFYRKPTEVAEREPVAAATVPA
jgi:hypothetical protein